MEYILLFLEGIITFISPCLLPMLPIYLSYFAAGEANRKKALKNSLGFVLGFTLVFTLLGAFAGTIGSIFKKYELVFNIVCGIIVIILGLNFIGVIKIGFLNRTSQKNAEVTSLGFFSSVVFGIVFSIGWTPCVGAFLGSALMIASTSGSVLSGIFMLLVYSLGLGIPFIVSALLLDRLKSAFDFIKKHYKVINTVSGVLLIIVGLLIASGLMGRLLSALSF